MGFVDRVFAAGRAAVEAFGPPPPAPVVNDTIGRSAPVQVGGANEEQNAPICPWPIIDKYPIILGSNLSLAHISACMRLSQTGYRMQYVDVLDELLEREPHGYAVLQQRIITVAGGRLEITAPKRIPLEKRARAEEIATEIRNAVFRIPRFQQALADLLWGLYYGVAAQEISWTNDNGFWRPTRLHMIHSRRLSYPDPGTWDLHIWDQGMVHNWNGDYQAPTQRVFGVNIHDYPHKFIVHAPRLRGDYPTRDGLGRELVYWFAVKAMGARAASHYLERFGKPWPIAKFATQPDGKPRAANDIDIAKADAAMRALGIGSMAGAVLPNSIEVELYGPGQKGAKIALSHEAWIAVCNAEISKCVQGQTFTTETGKFGSRSTADVGESNAMRIGAYDAQNMGETLKEGLGLAMVELNYPGEEDLVPEFTIHIENEPNAGELINRAQKAVTVGLPIDADEFGRLVGMPLTPNEDGKPRRMVPLAPADVFETDDTVESEEAKKEAEEAAQRTQEQHDSQQAAATKALESQDDEEEHADKAAE